MGGGGEEGAGSVQATASEVVRDDDVGDSVKNHLDVIRVCRTRHVTVNLLVRRAVFAFELCLDICCSVFICVGTCGKIETRERKSERFCYQEKKTPWL